MTSRGNGSVWMSGERQGDKKWTEEGRSGGKKEQEGVLLDYYRWCVHSCGRGGNESACDTVVVKVGALDKGGVRRGRERSTGNGCSCRDIGTVSGKF